jgi:limonene-1,2-epoxide hydrolase
MGSPSDAEQIVRQLCDTFEKHDAEAFRPLLADDVVYHNIPMEPVVGLEDAITFLSGFLAMCDRMVIETTHLAVRDDVVLTERIDTFTVNGKEVPLPVMGTFEIRDGKIAAWRDYFDMAQITAAWSGSAE